jgi:hypothetical protein
MVLAIPSASINHAQRADAHQRHRMPSRRRAAPVGATSGVFGALNRSSPSPIETMVDAARTWMAVAVAWRPRPRSGVAQQYLRQCARYAGNDRPPSGRRGTCGIRQRELDAEG